MIEADRGLKAGQVAGGQEVAQQEQKQAGQNMRIIQARSGQRQAGSATGD